MDLALTLSPHDRGPLRLFVNGRLEAEIVGGTVQTAAVLAAEVTAARSLQALARFVKQWQRALTALQDVPDHTARTPAARQAAFCRGLEAGLCDTTVPHPLPGVPPVPPEHSASYRAGYDHGQALRACLAFIPEETT